MIWQVYRVRWDDTEAIQEYLNQGWEPFAAVTDGGGKLPFLYIRRKVDAEGNSLRDAS